MVLPIVVYGDPVLRKVGAEPETDDPHETDKDFAQEDEAREAARDLATKLLIENET